MKGSCQLLPPAADERQPASLDGGQSSDWSYRRGREERRHRQTEKCWNCKTCLVAQRAGAVTMALAVLIELLGWILVISLGGIPESMLIKTLGGFLFLSLGGIPEMWLQAMVIQLPGWVPGLTRREVALMWPEGGLFQLFQLLGWILGWIPAGIPRRLTVRLCRRRPFRREAVTECQSQMKKERQCKKPARQGQMLGKRLRLLVVKSCASTISQ
ncbi:uncharacterized protein LOC127028523 isoform X6 [Gymnogyps californianus]|uniref:uncharacterized protein LOC127028523 isoform X6 n=1 Tax=Gymnogyps californianus TaxID=33616 RepID=UPI0021C68295|nr:uncharacterized protein LOC127028523 isoform X6 [Gymnogyps californianus]